MPMLITGISGHLGKIIFKEVIKSKKNISLIYNKKKLLTKKKNIFWIKKIYLIKKKYIIKQLILQKLYYILRGKDWILKITMPSYILNKLILT